MLSSLACLSCAKSTIVYIHGYFTLILTLTFFNQGIHCCGYASKQIAEVGSCLKSFQLSRTKIHRASSDVVVNFTPALLLFKCLFLSYIFQSSVVCVQPGRYVVNTPTSLMSPEVSACDAGCLESNSLHRSLIDEQVTS